MKCYKPKKVPVRLVREHIPKGLLRFQRRDRVEGLRLAPCGKCHACRMNALYGKTYRICWEIDSRDHLASLLTCTYEDEHLPYSAGSLAGLTDDQSELRARIGKRSQDFRHLSDRDTALMKILDTPQAPMPTVSGRDARLMRMRIKKRFGKQAIIVGSLEYGTHGGRPHLHMLIIGLEHGHLEWIRKRWTKGITHALQATTDKIAAYVAKDSVKGSYFAEQYVAEGRERPRLLWARNPYVGESQEATIYSTIERAAKLYTPLEVEQGIQAGLIGRWYRRENHHRPFSATAHRKMLERALENGLRSSDVIQKVRLARELEDWTRKRMVDPDDQWYTPDEARAHERQIDEARLESEHTRAVHEQILGRRRSAASRVAEISGQ